MFESLSTKLGNVLDSLRGRTVLQEEDVELALREIRMALLEADVALPVVKDFTTKIRERATGQAVIKSVSPAEQVVKIVHDGIVEMLGVPEEAELNLAVTPPAVILMVGLQGAGKTTTSGKLAKYLTAKSRKKVLMASLDTQRPAAQEQLAVLGTQTGVDTLEIIAGQTPLDITERALKEGKLGAYDVLILDTAGRLSIDEVLMAEVAQVRDLARPQETLLVVDAMTGQDAVNTAHEFNTRIGITGTVLTRIDGDARGGAAMSMRGVTGKPIKYLGTGEKLDAIEPFHPDRIAGRILGMGDIVSLVEKAVETIDRQSAEEAARKFQEGKFDLNDFKAQLEQMRNMGGIGSMMKMLPGLSKFASQIEEANLDGTVLKKQEAIMSSMTKAERSNPSLIITNASRRRRIATGSGTNVQDVNRLMKQFEQMQTMMNRVRKMGLFGGPGGGMLGMAKNLMGAGGFNALMGKSGLDPNDLAALEQEMGNSPMGNPFAGPLGGGFPPNMGAGMGLPGMGANPFGGGKPPKSFFTKSKKKKRK